MKPGDIQATVKAFLVGIVSLVQGIASGVASLLGVLRDGFMDIVTAIIKPFRSLASLLLTGLKGFATGLLGILRVIGRGVAGAVSFVGGIVLGLLKSIGGGIKTVVLGIGRFIMRVLRAFHYRYLLPFLGWLLRGVRALKQIVASFLGTVGGVVKTIFGFVGGLFLGLGRWVLGGFRAVGKRVYRVLASIGRRVYGFFSALASLLMRGFLWFQFAVLWVLWRVGRAFLRTGNSCYLLLLPAYNSAVSWFNDHHPFLALFGRVGKAFLRVGWSTALGFWFAGRWAVRGLRAFFGYLKRFVLGLGQLVMTVLKKCYQGLAWFARKLVARALRTLGRWVWVTAKLVGSVALKIFTGIYQLLVWLGRGVVMVAKTIWVPVAWTLKHIHRGLVSFGCGVVWILKAFWGGLAWFGSRVARALRRARDLIVYTVSAVVYHVGRFLRAMGSLISWTAHQVFSFFRRLALAFHRSGATIATGLFLVLSFSTDKLLALGTLIGDPLLRALLRELQAWARVLYSIYLSLWQVGQALGNVLFLVGLALRENYKTIRDLGLIFSPFFLCLGFFAFTGSLPMLFWGLGYFTFIIIASVLYNRLKRGEPDV